MPPKRNGSNFFWTSDLRSVQKKSGSWYHDDNTNASWMMSVKACKLFKKVIPVWPACLDDHPAWTHEPLQASAGNKTRAQTCVCVHAGQLPECNWLVYNWMQLILSECSRDSKSEIKAVSCWAWDSLKSAGQRTGTPHIKHIKEDNNILCWFRHCWNCAKELRCPRTWRKCSPQKKVEWVMPVWPRLNEF